MRMLLSDIWSRSNFWVTVHASWVLTSAKQIDRVPPIYRLNPSLLLQMLVSFARSYTCLSDSEDICGQTMEFKMSQVFPTVSLDITDKREMIEFCQLCGTSQAFGNKACAGRVCIAKFTPGVPRWCWKCSHSIFLKTLSFLPVWTSFLAFSFRCVCSAYV